ncbi:MAG: hypothetical protein ABWZ25_17915 [Chitinophagaceae bacterium]
MRLHEDKELFREAVQTASQQLNIPEIYIEKDYWVTIALYRIFSTAAGKFAIFRGGTAFKMQPFGVLVLSRERTFCEKVMSLVRFMPFDRARAKKTFSLPKIVETFNNKENLMFYSSKLLNLNPG